MSLKQCVATVPAVFAERFGDEFRRMFPKHRVTLVADLSRPRVFIWTNRKLKGNDFDFWNERYWELYDAVKV
jgi:hypothetical protein